MSSTPRFVLDRKYAVFGRVIAGMTYVDAIPHGAVEQLDLELTRAYLILVIPAKAGTQSTSAPPPWVPAFAGMTRKG